MLPDVTEHTRATSFADSIVRPLVKSLPLVCAGLNESILLSENVARSVICTLAAVDHVSFVLWSEGRCAFMVC